ncbi:MAG: DUF6498-containing protein [Crocinitomicaceae bacterium]
MSTQQMFFNKIDYKAPSVVSLLVLNGVFLIAAIIFHWKAFDLVFVFWLENLVIGVYNVFKLAKAQGLPNTKGAAMSNQSQGCMKVIFIPFFLVHYFGFCAGHGVFIFVLFGKSGMGKPDIWEQVSNLDIWVIIASVISLFISHGISFFSNYIGKKEYLTTTAQEQMMSPYKRIVLVHIFIMSSGFLFMQAGGSFFSLILFFALKTIIDLRQHFKEHQKTMEKA